MSTASIGILGTSTYGIHLIFLGWIFRGSRPGIFDFFALCVALTGTYLVIPEVSLSNHITSGLLVAILSGFCFALLPILHQRNRHLPDRLRTFGQLFGAWIVFLFFLPATDWQLTTDDWWALLYLAVPGTFFSHWLWIRVTTRISTTITSIIFYLIIPMTMIISHYWLGEDMPVQKITGAMLIVSGNILSLYGRRRQNSKRFNS
jgi:drug/metabolite transporter (DMT)-like permease